MKHLKAYEVHFGCRLNQYESSSLRAGLTQNNIIVSNDIQSADYIIINTCTVTNRSDQKNRQAIRAYHTENPSAKIIVTGCYATTDAEDIKKISGVYKVVGNNQKALIPQIIQNPDDNTLLSQDATFDYNYRAKEGQSRAYLKIQDGCNKSCSYCKIPQARGSGRSRNIQNTIHEARYLIENNFKELVLTGVNIGWYNDNNTDFYQLLDSLLNLNGDFQIRISSIEPSDVTPDLASFFTHPKLAKFLHVPLQSGSKQILKWMNRGYTPQLYLERIQYIREICKNIHIGTDIIVGFPGETEELFNETLEFSKLLNFANIHIFPFSKRRNTPLEEKMLQHNLKEIKGDIIKGRCQQLSTLKEEMMQNYINTTQNIQYRGIIEKVEDNYCEILTENYVRLKGKADTGLLQKGDSAFVKYQNTQSFNIYQPTLK